MRIVTSRSFGSTKVTSAHIVPYIAPAMTANMARNRNRLGIQQLHGFASL
jgi:hypothetical protein